MNKTPTKATKKTVAILLAVLILLSTVAGYFILDIFGDDSHSGEIVSQDIAPEEVIDPTNEKVVELLQQLDESMMLKHIEKLVSWGPHPTAFRLGYRLSNRPIIGRFFDLPIEKVAKYIFKEFENIGLEVKSYHWDVETKKENLRKNGRIIGFPTGDNIEATLPGTDRSSNKIIVALAHYDTWPGSPGANDDSSGVAALLCLAKLMSQYSFEHTIRFLAVDGHEQWLLGSHAYTKRAAKNNDNIIAAFTIDMIGDRDPDKKETEFDIITGNEKSQWITDYLVDVNQRYAEYLNFTINHIDPEGRIADYMEFIDDGYDSIHLTGGKGDPDRHKPSDTIENMDVPYATHVSKLILATLAELAWDTEI
jgi:hypothetical protein